MGSNSTNSLPDATACDASAGPRQVTFDPDSDSVTETVVDAVADLEGVSPTSLDPLYDTIDPDALDSIVRSAVSRPSPGEVAVTVRYEGYAVTVHGYGVVEIAPERSP